MRNPLWLAIFVVGCERPDARDAAIPTAAVDDRIECAIGGADRFSRVCELDAAAADDPLLTIRHPDGGFRRLEITRDGRGVVAADGAAVASLQILADRRIEVAIDGDRYRLPATLPGR